MVTHCMDATLINKIITHPKVYPFVSDDHAPSPEEFDCSKALETEGVYFLTPIDDEVLGCFMVHRHTLTLYEIHTCLLPWCWGERALQAADAVRRWVFENTTCKKLMTWVPKGNRLAYRFAIKSGMKDEGLSTKSYLKNGVLLDQHLLGIEKEMTCP